jgi:hypothetical protein
MASYSVKQVGTFYVGVASFQHPDCQDETYKRVVFHPSDLVKSTVACGNDGEGARLEEDNDVQLEVHDMAKDRYPIAIVQ